MYISATYRTTYQILALVFDERFWYGKIIIDVDQAHLHRWLQPLPLQLKTSYFRHQYITKFGRTKSHIRAMLNSKISPSRQESHFGNKTISKILEALGFEEQSSARNNRLSLGILVAALDCESDVGGISRFFKEFPKNAWKHSSHSKAHIPLRQKPVSRECKGPANGNADLDSCT